MKLRQYIYMNELNGSRFAESIGYSPKQIYDYLRGIRCGSRKFLELVEYKTKGELKVQDLIDDFNKKVEKEAAKKGEQK